MHGNLNEKIKESLSSVLPITVIVFVLTVTVIPATGELLFMFGVGAVFLIIGLGLFTLGADLSMIIIGEKIGAKLTRLKKMYFIIPVIFVIGVMITVAEPDLKVLAEQAPIVDTDVLVWAVGIGVGIFLVISFMRIFLQIRLSYILLVMYVIIFAVVISPLMDKDFIPVAFDSGGVTTGPMTVPFIMALGLGLSGVRGDKTQHEDSFGLVALCSIGPIAIVILLGILNSADEVNASLAAVPENDTVRESFAYFIDAIPEYAGEVTIALLPIAVFFLVFNSFSLKMDKKTVLKILIGMGYAFLGLIIFLTGVNIGFMPVGQYIGSELAKSSHSWQLIPIGMVIGYFIVAAEPAVHVLKEQVETITEGAISGKSLGISLSIGVSVSVGIAMIRVLTGISILWFLIPGYFFAIIMTFFVPAIFTAVAFDAGGVASGPMTATFLLPLAMGACDGRGGTMATDAFGVVAMVAMTPLITIQFLGLLSLIKEKRALSAAELAAAHAAPPDITADEPVVIPMPETEVILDEHSDELVLFD